MDIERYFMLEELDKEEMLLHADGPVDLTYQELVDREVDRITEEIDNDIIASLINDFNIKSKLEDDLKAAFCCAAPQKVNASKLNVLNDTAQYTILNSVTK